jgi:predicted PurR-regulated permease PerM
VLDALPIFGTGTIFIPWIIILFFNGEWIRGVEVGILYLICYFLREFMEDHLMGESMGITALEFLASVYVGLKLFGGVGFLLGPIGYLIIRLGMKMF